MKTVVQPPCSPELNPAERVKSLVSWEWIRWNVQGLPEDYAASSC